MQKLAAPTASMAEPLASLRRLKGSFGPLEKKDLTRQSPEPTVCATPPTVSYRAQSLQSGKREVLERLKRPECRSWLLQRLVWQNHWQVSRGLKGSFGPLEKKDLARQSPEPIICATSKVEPLASFEGFEAFEGQFRATRKKEFAGPEPRADNLRNSAHSLAQSP